MCGQIQLPFTHASHRYDDIHRMIIIKKEEGEITNRHGESRCNTLFSISKQPVYKQPGLERPKIKQHLGLNHLITSNFYIQP